MGTQPNDQFAHFSDHKAMAPKFPDRLQLYSLSTPTGVKVSIMLEETGIPYEVHKIDFARKDQRTPEYLSLNPNGKIPAVIDPDGPDGVPFAAARSRGCGQAALCSDQPRLRPCRQITVQLEGCFICLKKSTVSDATARCASSAPVGPAMPSQPTIGWIVDTSVKST